MRWVGSLSLAVSVLLLGACDGSFLRNQPTEELCNGLDDDQDGAVDEGFADIDGDGLADCVDGQVDELCNGLDDNGNGEIDEGFDDLDSDGAADCVDADCDVVHIEPTTEVCGSVVLSDQEMWDVVVEMRMIPDDSLGSQVWPTGPVLIGQSGSGTRFWSAAVDTETPDPARDFSAWTFTQDGTAVEAHWGWLGWARFRDVSAGPVRQFTMPFEDWSTNLAAPLVELDPSGVEVWSTAPLPATPGGTQPLLYVDSAGTRTLSLLGAAVNLDANTLFDYPPVEGPTELRMVADLDLDGAPEILDGSAVYDETMTSMFSTNDGYVAAYVVLASRTSNEGEVLAIADQEFRWFTSDGTLIRESPRFGGLVGPPCLADFDGDGVADLGLVSSNLGQSRLGVYDAYTGAELWEVPGELGPAAYGGCSAFDFDGDGRYELLYEGATGLEIRSGTDGTLHYEFPIRSGHTFGYPTLADVDGDGSVEIVVASQGDEDTRGIWVLGHRRSLWMPGERRSWAQHAFTGSSLDEDLLVRPSPPTPWLDWDMLRGMPPGERGFPNLVPELAACASGCGASNEVELAVAVLNAGTAMASGEALIEVLDVGGALLASSTVELSLGPGAATSPVVLLLRGDQLGAGIEIRVSADGLDGEPLAECVLSDNVLTWGGGLCEQ